MMKRHLEEKQVNSAPHEEKNGTFQDKSRQSNSRWNNIHLLLVCIVLPGLLMFLLDWCRPSSDPSIITLPALWDWSSAAIVLLFTLLQAALYHLPVGQVAEGKMGNDGKCLKYKLNGMYAFLVCVSVSVCVWQCGVFRWSSVMSRVIPLISAGSVLSFIISVALYTLSHTPTDSIVEGFALGRDSDPCVGMIDLKHFMMLRIGFIGWAMMDVCYLLTALERDGSVPPSLALVFIFQLVYILDLLIDEDSILSTKEFTEESIGFLMVMGEYIWIPFFSSLPLYFLLHRPCDTDLLSSLPIILLFAAGFLIYYRSNDQKSGFRNNPRAPAFTHLETIRSPSGQNLLVSGWFGWVRHPNYLGDIVMMFAWALPCGFSSVLPYLPALQCVKLLRERAEEIEESCEQRHGAAWREYCRRVPYKLLPYIY
ncbi:delta(14)-sterol reductase LBR [Trichomycterus rosablanca]|uniref:delta(14)-sterol reductase LBR n=1 Tax=Trichomycterus rosablanca TaxID=2290929 RepID=UPI002F35EEEE